MNMKTDTNHQTTQKLKRAKGTKIKGKESVNDKQHTTKEKHQESKHYKEHTTEDKNKEKEMEIYLADVRVKLDEKSVGSLSR